MAGQQRSQRMADGADALHIGGTGQRLRLLVREGAGALRVFLHKEGGCQQAVKLSAEVGVGAAAALLVLQQQGGALLTGQLKGVGQTLELIQTGHTLARAENVP